MTKSLGCINDVCKFSGGSQPPKEVFESTQKEGYIRLIQTRDYKSDNFLTYIPKKLARKTCNSSDIMIGRYGPPVFQIFRGIEGAYNVALMKAIPKEGVDNDYLFYLLKQKEILKYVEGLSLRTGGQTGVDLVALREYPIIARKIDEQKKIAHILSTLDKKIEVNNKINAKLEAMAKLVYDYWFVQFDFPNAEGKPYKSSGGKMVFNEVLKREVPEGWEVGRLIDIADITMGQSPSGSSYNDEGEGMIFYQGATDFGLRFPTVRKYTTEPTRYAKKHDILMSVRAPVGTLNISKEDCCIGRGLAALRGRKGVNSYVFEVMKDFKTIFDRRNSSGTTFGSITKNDLFSLPVVIPDENVLKVFGDIAKSFDEKIFNNNEQTQQLASLRDWLLPMLMNGQVRVE